MVDFVLSTDSNGYSRGFGWATYVSFNDATNALKRLSGLKNFVFFLNFDIFKVFICRGTFYLFVLLADEGPPMIHV
jgi:hypothetical protein